MRIYDSSNNKTIDDVVLYLTPDEAKELHNDLGRIMEKPRGNHVHVSSNDYQHELTVCVYRKEDIDTFDEKSRKILEVHVPESR